MNLLEHLPQVIATLLRDDERRVLLGEDVADGGMLGLSRQVMQDESLVHRVISTPLLPTTALAHAGGLALSGLRPIVLLPSSMPLLEGLAGLREATLLPWRSSEALSVPLLIVAPCGPGFGLGGDAIEGPEALMARVPGLRVLIAGDALEAGALLHAAAEFWAGEQPTVVFLPRGLLLQEAQFESAPRQLTRPFAAARPVRTGTAATVFTWGNAVASTLVAVARTGLDVGVVDVECLAPLDRGTLVEQARRTGKLVIVHEGPRAHGLGAELAALFADEAILHLDAPIVRVTGDEPPFRAEHEGRAAPTIESIAEAITHVATY